MSYLIFNNLVDMTTVATPSSGYTLAYDLDGTIKQKDQYGVITPISGSGGSGTPSLFSVLTIGNTTGTSNLIIASGTGLISDFGSGQINFNLDSNSHVYISSDNGLNQESLIDLSNDSILLKSSGNTKSINLGVSQNYSSVDYQDISIIENTFVPSSVDSNDRSSIFIGTKASSFAAGVSNSVIIGGSSLSATQSNTVYLGNTVNINGQYSLPNTDGVSNQILRTDGLGNISWQNDPNLESVLSIGATTGNNDIIIQSGQFLRSTSGNGTIDLGSTANKVIIQDGIGESISISENLIQIFVTPSSTTQSSISIGINNDDLLVSGNLTSATSSDIDKNIIFISTRNSSSILGITNSVIIGGSGIIATQSNTLYTNNLQLQGNVLGRYTVQPSTQPGWDSLSIPTKGYVDNIFSSNVTGTGTANYLPKWTGSASLSATSSFFELGLTASTLTNLSINGVYAGKGAANIPTNTAFGFESINSATSSGTNNTAIGGYSLRINGTGYDNTAVGLSSMQLNLVGYKNSAFGAYSLRTNSTGYQNIAIGCESMFSNTTSNNNVSIGVQSLYTNTTGSLNVSVGNESLHLNTIGNYNIGIGHQSLNKNTTGSYNTSLGGLTLFSNITGQYNVGMGYQTMYNLFGSNNTAIGSLSLAQSTTASNNTTIGYGSLNLNITGGNNSAIGSLSGLDNRIGNNNTFLGYNTGRGLTAGSNNTFVGANITVSAGTTGSIYISDGSGNARIISDSIGNVGINTILPNVRLDILGDIATRHGSIVDLSGTYNDYSTANTSFIIVENSSASPAYITGFAGGFAGKRLVISNTGPDDVIIQHSNVSSSASNRIITGNLGNDIIISDNQSCELIYEILQNRWRVNSSVFENTFENGITEINSGGVYGLGGDLSQNTSINGDSYNFAIEGANTITLTASTINLGQSIVINNAYTLPSTDGSSGYVLMTDGLGITSWTSSVTKKHKDLRTFTSSVVETISHNLNTDDISVQTYDSTGLMIIPGTIQVTGTGSVDILFSTTLTNVKTIIIG